MRNPLYICFRYSIIPAPRSLLYEPKDDREKKLLFQQSFLENKDHVVSGCEYAIRIRNYFGNFYYGKLSKRVTVEHFDKTPIDITESEQDSWPFIEFLCNTDKQAIVFKLDTTIFPRIQKLKFTLNNIASSLLFPYGYTVNFDPILEKTTFWKIIKQSDKIYSVRFNLEAPNMLNGAAKASELMHHMKHVYNITHTSIGLTNSSGELNVTEENVETFRDYADKGAGSWSVTSEINGKRQTTRSVENARKVPINKTEDTNEMLDSAYNKFEKHL